MTLNDHSHLQKILVLGGNEHQPVPNEWLNDNEREIRQEIEQLTVEKNELPQSTSGDKK